jgi:hypothetical protein
MTLVRHISALFWLAMALGPSGRAQAPDIQPKPSILVAPSPTVSDHRFLFSVKVYAIPGDKREATLSVFCSEDLTCSPDQQLVNTSEAKVLPFTATLEDNANSAEISVQLAIKGDPNPISTSKALDFGLWNSVSKVGNSDPEELVGGSESKIRLWLQDSKGNKIRPSSNIQIEASSTGCIALKTILLNENEKSKAYGNAAATAIKAGAVEASEALWLKPGYWTRSQCNLDVVLSSGGEIQNRFSISLPIKSNYLPALAICLLGAFCQFFLAALVNLAIAARAKETVVLKALFVGAYGVEIIDMFLKGTLAFVLAYILDSTDIIKFKSANSTSLSGFCVFAFLIGFWQIQPLWAALSRMAKGSEAPKAADNQTSVGEAIKTPTPGVP